MRRLGFVAPIVGIIALLLSWERELSVWVFSRFRTSGRKLPRS